MESNNERMRGFLPQDVRKKIAKLDASSLSDRKAVLKTIASLVETYTHGSLIFQGGRGKWEGEVRAW